jgi:hypothetical protein
VVVHVVLFRPKPNLSEDQRRALFDALHAAATEIAAVRRFFVGTRVTHGAAYEQLPGQDYPFAAIFEFDNLAGLQAYLRHPRHEKVGSLFYELQEGAVACDYDLLVNPHD